MKKEEKSLVFDCLVFVFCAIIFLGTAEDFGKLEKDINVMWVFTKALVLILVMFCLGIKIYINPYVKKWVDYMDNADKKI